MKTICNERPEYERGVWICSDADRCQYVIELENDLFRLMQIQEIGADDGDDLFSVVLDTVDLADISPEDLLDCLNMYGYSSESEVKEIYGGMARQVMAECVFETYSCLNSENWIATGAYDYCRGYIEGVVQRQRMNEEEFE